MVVTTPEEEAGDVLRWMCEARKSRKGVCPVPQWVHGISQPFLLVKMVSLLEINHLDKSPCRCLSLYLSCLDYLSLVGQNYHCAQPAWLSD